MSHEIKNVEGGQTVAAIMTTYNRKELLLRCLTALLNQTRSLDKIYVVDNASTDGTLEYLKAHQLLPHAVVEWYELGANLGCSGGFHHGMKKGYSEGYDWLWVMDDDARPEADALELLLDSAPPDACMYSVYIAPGTKNFAEPVVLMPNGEEPQRFWTIPEEMEGCLVEGLGGPPLGLLVPRKVVDSVGFPREDVFIFGEYEYLMRIREAGFKVYYKMDSILWHPAQIYKILKLPLRLKMLGRGSIWVDYPLYSANIWKEYYGIRNGIYFGVRAKPRRLLSVFSLSYVLLVDMGLKVYYGDQKLKRLRYLLKGFWDGLWGNMGKRIDPF